MNKLIKTLAGLPILFASAFSPHSVSAGAIFNPIDKDPIVTVNQVLLKVELQIDGKPVQAGDGVGGEVIVTDPNADPFSGDEPCGSAQELIDENGTAYVEISTKETSCTLEIQGSVEKLVYFETDDSYELERWEGHKTISFSINNPITIIQTILPLNFVRSDPVI